MTALITTDKVVVPAWGWIPYPTRTFPFFSTGSNCFFTAPPHVSLVGSYFLRTRGSLCCKPSADGINAEWGLRYRPLLVHSSFILLKNIHAPTRGIWGIGLPSTDVTTTVCMYSVCTAFQKEVEGPRTFSLPHMCMSPPTLISEPQTQLFGPSSCRTDHSLPQPATWA